MTLHILVPDNVHQKAIDILSAAEGIRVTAPGKMSREETLAAICEADGLIIRSDTQVNAEMLQAATRLKAVARAGVGVDNVDLAAATEKGVIVMNTPDGNTIATAEHTFGLMLALARHIPSGYYSMREGKWDRKSYMGVELRGKTLGIVGFGRIGRAVARRAIAFEMRVLAYDVFDISAQAREIGAEVADLDSLYAQSDFITLHPSLTDDTRGMINTQSLASMKQGVRIINAARGALIVDADLAEAIRSGRVAGAALDVFEPEPPSADNPLLGLPSVVYTPHLAASTTDAQISVAIDAAQQMVDGLLRGEWRNVVNAEVVRA